MSPDEKEKLDDYQFMMGADAGRLALAMDLLTDVMALVGQDTKLNISPAYLRPAFAFGGSCLPKDVRAMVREAEKSGASLPLLSLPFLTFADDVLDRLATWRARAWSASALATLVYSGYLQVEVNLLPFYAYYNARVALSATRPRTRR